MGVEKYKKRFYYLKSPPDGKTTFKYRADSIFLCNKCIMQTKQHVNVIKANLHFHVFLNDKFVTSTT